MAILYGEKRSSAEADRQVIKHGKAVEYSHRLNQLSRVVGNRTAIGLAPEEYGLRSWRRKRKEIV